jgi:hypothetical protein
MSKTNDVAVVAVAPVGGDSKSFVVPEDETESSSSLDTFGAYHAGVLPPLLIQACHSHYDACCTSDTDMTRIGMDTMRMMRMIPSHTSS